MRQEQPRHSKPDRPRHPFARLLPLTLAVVLATAACSGGDFESADTASDEAGSFEQSNDFDDVSEAMESEESADFDSAGEAADAAPDAPESVPALGTGGAPSDSLADATSQVDPESIGRDIIRTAAIQADVDNVAEASTLAITRIEGLGGLLFGQQTTTEGTPRSTLTFKVQPRDFSEALDRLSDLGFLRDQTISADDVTDRVVDLESRIITAEASVERLRGFLEEANDLTTIASLEGQLLERETALELLRGQLRTLENQVSLATITITFVEIVPGPAIELVATAYPGHDEGSTCDGDENLQVDEADLVTVCFRVTNVGDTNLTEIEVRDDRFDLEAEQLLVHSGDLDQPLEPGESVVLYGEIIAEENATGRAQASAKPVDAEGEDLRLANVAARSDFFLTVDPDTSVPSFGEGFGAGWGAFVTFIQVLVLVAGVILPWIWLPVALWFGIRWMRKRQAAKPAKPVQNTQPVQSAQGFTPPPPVQPAPPAQTVQPVPPVQPETVSFRPDANTTAATAVLEHEDDEADDATDDAADEATDEAGESVALDVNEASADTDGSDVDRA